MTPLPPQRLSSSQAPPTRTETSTPASSSDNPGKPKGTESGASRATKSKRKNPPSQVPEKSKAKEQDQDKQPQKKKKKDGKDGGEETKVEEPPAQQPPAKKKPASRDSSQKKQDQQPKNDAGNDEGKAAQPKAVADPGKNEDFLKKLGDMWWSEEHGVAFRQMKAGVERSGPPFQDGEDVKVKFACDGLVWILPNLIPADLEKFGQEPLKKLPKPDPKAKPSRKKKSDEKPVQDYVLDVVRCKYAKQGQGNPIIKVECRVNRHDLSSPSQWKQKLQVVIREDVSARFAMNVAITFANCYQYMNLNPEMLNFRECRDALISYGQQHHDFNKSVMDWKIVSDVCQPPFPPRPECPSCNLEGWSMGFGISCLLSRSFRVINYIQVSQKDWLLGRGSFLLHFTLPLNPKP